MASTTLQLPSKESLKLRQRRVEKPWGRSDLPPPFGGGTTREPIGEIWFEHPSNSDLPLLVKYIFTSEKLSIQVHPDDAEARARGLAEGKSECWYVIDAEPGATIGLGLRRLVSRDELRNAALDGSIESMMDWIPVLPGDFYYVPAGTVHAIGAGLTLLELQQASDVTYRLFDYGRPRELHLDDGIAVATPGPSPSGKPPRGGSRGCTIGQHSSLFTRPGGFGRRNPRSADEAIAVGHALGGQRCSRRRNSHCR